MGSQGAFGYRTTFGEFSYQSIKNFRYPANEQADSTQSMEFGKFRSQRIHFE